VTSAAIRTYLDDLAAAALTAPAAAGVSRGHLAQVRAGARLFRDALHDAPEREWRPSTVPASDDFTSASTALATRLLELSPTLPWIPARQDPNGQDRALLSVNDLFDIGDVIAGFVLVRPNSFYPLHEHPPQELYFTIDGTGEWRFGGAELTAPVGPGQVFYNPPAVLHEQRNGPATNISFYVLWD